MATQTATELEVLDERGSQLISEIPSHAKYEARRLSSHAREPAPAPPEQSPITLPKGRSMIITAQLAGINFITSFCNGILTIGLPTMATELSLKPALLLWPSSAYYLTSGATLLIAGAVADVIGARTVNLTGCLFLAVFMVANSVAQTGLQLIMFRAMQGIASSLVVPTAISIISTSVETGRRRNLAFASLGLAMPLGFSAGLVLGGVFVSGPGWRVGYYIAAALSAIFCLLGTWALPKGVKEEMETPLRTRLMKEIDWVGAGIASTALALFSYVLAILSAEVDNIRNALTIAFLVISVIFIPTFTFWMSRQEKKGKVALIPNSIWKKATFTTISVMVLISTAVANCIELFSSLFFQEVQQLSALQASLRILPSLIVGVAINFAVGYFIHRIPAMWLVLIASALCAISPLLMALIDPAWPYWYCAFPAQIFAPISVDVLFTVGIIIVSDVFPQRTQALAGAVFNTLSQLGTSVGLATTAVVSSAVTDKSSYADKESPAALMEGYRAAFWMIFAWMAVSCVVGAFGLRRLGKIGEKRD